MMLTVHHRGELFRWATFQEWVNNAARDFRGYRANCRLDIGDYICLDAAGNVCTKGAEFMAARDNGRFPVVCWLVVTP